MLWQHMKVCIKNQYINIYFFFYFITLFTLHVYADKHTALKSVWKCLYYFYRLFHCPWDVYYYVAKHKPIDMKLDETIIFSKILLSTMKYGGLKMQVCILSVFFFLQNLKGHLRVQLILHEHMTNAFILIHVFCLQAMCVSLVNATSVSFWGNVWVMFYWNIKWENSHMPVHNQFYLKLQWNERPVFFFSEVHCAVAFVYLLWLLQWPYYG